MSNEQIKKLLVNCPQTLTEPEKLQGRANLGCAALDDVITDSVRYSSQSPSSSQQAIARSNIGAVSGSEVSQAIEAAIAGLEIPQIGTVTMN